MWSLGCVTVVCLTGGYPFFDPETDGYSEDLARACDLRKLKNSVQWQTVGPRPEDFVSRLLVMDEDKRMTATAALEHEWFANDFHKTDFEELYSRTIKHWRPRRVKQPVIRLLSGSTRTNLPSRQDLGHAQKQDRKKGPTPVDPPYKPFPRHMNQSLLPKRKPNIFNTMPEDIKSAIKDKWTFVKSQASCLEGKADLQLPSEMSETDTTDMNSHQPEITKVSQRQTGTDSRFKPMFPRAYPASLQGAGNVERALVGGGHSASATEERDASDPAAWNNNITARNIASIMTSAPAIPHGTPIPGPLATEPCFQQESLAPPLQVEQSENVDSPQKEDAAEAIKESSPNRFQKIYSSPLHTSLRDSNELLSADWLVLKHSATHQNVVNTPERRRARSSHLRKSPSTELVETDIHPEEIEQRCSAATSSGLQTANPKAKLRMPTRPVRYGLRAPLTLPRKRRRDSIFDFEEDESEEDCLLKSKDTSLRRAKTSSPRVEIGKLGVERTSARSDTGIDHYDSVQPLLGNRSIQGMHLPRI